MIEQSTIAYNVKLEKNLHKTSYNKRRKFLRKIDKVFDSLIIRGNSFNRRQIRKKKNS